MFGIKQSGDMIFKLVNLKKDFKMLMAAKEDSEFYLENNSMEDYIINKNVKQLEKLD